MILLIRHAVAGEKAKWKGRPDHERPLSGRGRKQAKALVKQHKDRPVERIVSSPYTRCVDTVAPLAEKLGLEVEVHDALRPDASWEQFRALLDELADQDVALCTHGELIGVVVDHLPDLGIKAPKDPSWKKSSTWVLRRKKDRWHKASYKAPPR